MTETESCRKIFLDLDQLLLKSDFVGINEYLKTLNTEISTIAEIKSALIMTDFDSENSKIFLDTRNELVKLMEEKKAVPYSERPKWNNKN